LTIGEALAGAAETLRSRGIDTARLDAEVLLAFVLNTSRLDLHVNSREVLPDGIWHGYNTLIERRAGREPVAYITGEKEFMSLAFYVDRNVLVPRPETEILVEWIIEKIRERPGFSTRRPVIMDVGTGSGSIAVSLAKYVSRAEVWAVDISEKALDTACRNARTHKVDDRISFLQSDLLTGIPAGLKGRVDFMAANLPYIPSREIPHLMAEVAGFEPYIALNGGGDGLDLYRKLIPQAREVLHTCGWLGMEVGAAQAEKLAPLLSERIWGESAVVLKDYTGVDRFVVVQKKN
jgi:release factor glutamine methyltransferase